MQLEKMNGNNLRHDFKDAMCTSKQTMIEKIAQTSNAPSTLGSTRKNCIRTQQKYEKAIRNFIVTYFKF